MQSELIQPPPPNPLLGGLYQHFLFGPVIRERDWRCRLELGGVGATASERYTLSMQAVPSHPK